jgi:hypothetical protein
MCIIQFPAATSHYVCNNIKLFFTDNNKLSVNKKIYIIFTSCSGALRHHNQILYFVNTSINLLNVSEERFASILKVETFSKLGTTSNSVCIYCLRCSYLADSLHPEDGANVFL